MLRILFPIELRVAPLVLGVRINSPPGNSLEVLAASSESSDAYASRIARNRQSTEEIEGSPALSRALGGPPRGRKGRKCIVATHVTQREFGRETVESIDAPEHGPDFKASHSPAYSPAHKT
jgi:hypothetical protein